LWVKTGVFRSSGVRFGGMTRQMNEGR